MRIAIVGNSGSGKSTLARELASVHHLASLDLDSVVWEPGRIAQPREPAAAISDVSKFCDLNRHWVIEGCYASLVKIALLRSAALLFIDPDRQHVSPTAASVRGSLTSTPPGRLRTKSSSSHFSG